VIPEWKPIEEPTIPKAVWYAAPVVLLAAAAGGYYYYTREKAIPPPPVAKAVPVPTPVAAEPEIRNPLPPVPAAAAKPLPPLDQSDEPVRQALTQLADAKSIDQFLVPEKLIRNIVVTIDNLPRSKTAVERRPVHRTPGTTVTVAEGETITLGEQNFARYAPFVELVQTTDSKQLAGIYLQYYPLFQQAYEDLGYPGKYFNDRVVEVIDHLLDTPTVRGPVRLTQPRVFYEFADPELEARSAGQKLLLRMGNANAAQIKAKLRELRTEIATRPQPQAAP
jgi:hypothetical protein